MKNKCDLCPRKAKKRFSTETSKRCGRHPAEEIKEANEIKEAVHRIVNQYEKTFRALEKL